VDEGNAGYIAYRSFDNGLMGDIYVQALTSNYLNVTGPARSIGANLGTGGEAPAMFKKGRTYYITYTPLCPFCNYAPTVYKTASRPLGPWSDYTQISSTSCGGQASFVSKLTINSATVYLYGAGLWHGGSDAPPSSGTALVSWEPRGFGFFNQGQANFFWTPLKFSGAAIKTLTCDASFTAPLTSRIQNSTSKFVNMNE
jgi:beta-xylosidase